MTNLMKRELMTITHNSTSLVQLDEDFWTPLEYVNIRI